VDGFTCGAPIAAAIRNTNTRSGDYNNLKDCPRPGHADYTAQIKYGGFQDAAGGGHFSGRLTAPLCIAGGMCKQWLEEMGIRIGAHISIIAGNYDEHFDDLNPELDLVKEDFPVLSDDAAAAMKDAISRARSEGDSVGGEIECAVTGLPAGVGEPMFGGIESRIAQIIYGIPAVKYLEFGGGMAAAYETGSSFNDPFILEDGIIRTETNNAGGILGGISNGMPVIFRAAMKPTPSIFCPQDSVDLCSMKPVTLSIKGRHDPCVAVRAVPVFEAAAAIAITDLLLDAKEI
jgi:chorismate synthase